MEEKCPCQTNIQACCACVSMHCDECHGHSKFVQGRFCSNCGRPLKAELTRLYVPKSEGIPCKIGDTVYTFRDYHSTKKIMSGKVSEMYFVGEEMKLCIVVKHISRGQWGKDVFGTYEEAERRLTEWQTKKAR